MGAALLALSLAAVATGRSTSAAAPEKREAAITDSRLTRKVTLAFKGTALSDLCDHLRAETDIALTAGRSVADEKVTLFCRETPLRDIMRQLSRPFGYTWLRSTLNTQRSTLDGSGPSVERRASSVTPEYRYELVQDLRSQLLEEELRSRDRNAALLALDREMEAYRKYLGLSPDAALERARTAPPEEKKLLQRLAGTGWGAVQLYFRLSPTDLSALRAGQALTFSVPAAAEEEVAAPGVHIGAGMRFGLAPERVQQPLPPEVARGVLQSLRDTRILIRGDTLSIGTTRRVPDNPPQPEGLPPAAVPQARPIVTLRLNASERGQLTLEGGAGVSVRIGANSSGQQMNSADLALGVSPTVLKPDNATANARLAREPSLQRHVTVKDVRRQASGVSQEVRQQAPGLGQIGRTDASRLTPDVFQKVTTADVLEALHRATGTPIVADFYTRLYRPEEVAVRDRPLFEALNQLADTMRLRWAPDGEWLQFRSTSFFQDRLKEVPNRLLERWAASRREHGALTLDDLVEIAQLSDAQLDSAPMAEGARLCFGLDEWDLTRNENLRPHLRFLAELTPTQRQQALSAAGAPFAQMTLPQQQAFIALALGPRSDQLQSLDQFNGATLRVAYSVPGWFELAVPGQGAGGAATAGSVHRTSPIRERTREAALQAARRLDPQTDAAQIIPTQLTLTILHTLRDPATGAPMEITRRAVSPRPGDVGFSMSTSRGRPAGGP
jgi:hypothetical protein